MRLGRLALVATSRGRAHTGSPRALPDGQASPQNAPTFAQLIPALWEELAGAGREDLADLVLQLVQEEPATAEALCNILSLEWSSPSQICFACDRLLAVTPMPRCPFRRTFAWKIMGVVATKLNSPHPLALPSGAGLHSPKGHGRRGASRALARWSCDGIGGSGGGGWGF